MPFIMRVGVQTLSAIAALQGRAPRIPNTPHMFTMIPIPNTALRETVTSDLSAGIIDSPATTFADIPAMTTGLAAATTAYNNIVDTERGSQAGMDNTATATSTFLGDWDGAAATSDFASSPYESGIDDPATTTTTWSTTSSPTPISVAPITVSIMVPTTEVSKETVTKTSELLETLYSEETVTMTSALFSTLFSKDTTTIVAERTTQVTAGGKLTTQVVEYTSIAVHEYTTTASELDITTAVVRQTIQRTATRSIEHTATSEKVLTQTAVVTEHSKTKLSTFLTTISVPQSTASVHTNGTAPPSPALSGHNVGLIAGVSVGAFVFASLLFAGVFMHRRRKAMKKAKDAELDNLAWHGAAMSLLPTSLHIGNKSNSNDTTERKGRRRQRSINDLYSATRRRRGPSLSPAPQLPTQVEEAEHDIEALVTPRSSPRKNKVDTRPLSSSSNHSLTDAGNKQIVRSPSTEGRAGHAAQVIRELAREELAKEVRQTHV